MGVVLSVPYVDGAVMNLAEQSQKIIAPEVLEIVRYIITINSKVILQL